jgi:hypothetical protein
MKKCYSLFQTTELRKNVVFDYQNDFDKLGIANGSAFIDLKDHKITSITVINAQNVGDYK